MLGPLRASRQPLLRWKHPPPGVRVVKNRSGAGDWLEKWKSPRTGEWVHNYSRQVMEAAARRKFAENRAFARALPAIRARYRQDLASADPARVLALVVALIDQAYFRVGNEDSDALGVHGATTLRRKHVRLVGRTAYFDYVGKKRQRQQAVLTDARIAALLRELLTACRRREDRLFRVDGAPVTARHVNLYLAPFGVTAKQFRTYHATRLAHEALRGRSCPPDQRTRVIEEVVEQVATKLGHTPAVCQASYIDGTVLQAFRAGRLS